MKTVQSITGGSCIGNPGPGGWACILRCGTEERLKPGDHELRESCDVEFVTDSQYLKQGVTEYLARWKANGWRTSDRKSVQNQDLWRELDELASKHLVRRAWVAGHGDHELQNRCDALALAAARRQGGR
jgi:ribonuclease HI